MPGAPDDVPTTATAEESTWLSWRPEDTYHTWIGQKPPEENFPLTPAASALVTLTTVNHLLCGRSDREEAPHRRDGFPSERLTLAFQNRVGYPVEVDPQWWTFLRHAAAILEPAKPHADAPATDLPTLLKRREPFGRSAPSSSRPDAKGEVQLLLPVVNSSAAGGALTPIWPVMFTGICPGHEAAFNGYVYGCDSVHADFIGEDWPLRGFRPAWNDQKAGASKPNGPGNTMSTTNKAVPKLGLHTMPHQRRPGLVRCRVSAALRRPRRAP